MSTGVRIGQSSRGIFSEALLNVVGVGLLPFRLCLHFMGLRSIGGRRANPPSGPAKAIPSPPQRRRRHPRQLPQPQPTPYHHHRRLARITTTVDLRGKWMVGSQYGWLALLDERSEVSLFNPLTREKIRLPSVTTLPLLTPYPIGSDQISGYYFTQSASDNDDMFVNDDMYPYTFEEFRMTSFKKVVLSSRPTTATGGGGGGRGFTAMVIFTIYNRIAIARPGEDKWVDMRNCPFVTDIIYRNGKFLGVSGRGSLLAFDVTGPSLEFTEIAKGLDYRLIGTDKYLVDSAGDLLMVLRYHDKSDYRGIGPTIAITIMKFAEEQGAWLPLNSLGDNSLFLGHCCSISLSVRDIPELRPNSVYYTQVLWNWLHKGDEKIRMPRDVFVFYLVDNTVDRYAPTDHRLCWTPPIWITPSLL